MSDTITMWRERLKNRDDMCCLWWVWVTDYPDEGSAIIDAPDAEGAQDVGAVWFDEDVENISSAPCDPWGMAAELDRLTAAAAERDALRAEVARMRSMLDGAAEIDRLVRTAAEGANVHAVLVDDAGGFSDDAPTKQPGRYAARLARLDMSGVWRLHATQARRRIQRGVGRLA